MMEEQDLKVRMNWLFLLGSLALLIPKVPQTVEKYKSMGHQSVAYSIIMTILAIGMLILFFKYVYSFIVLKIGKMLQGKASKLQVQVVLAYALVPTLISLLISVVLVAIAIVGKDVAIIGYQNQFTGFIIWIFAMRTFIFGIAQYNKFSYGYALLNLCIIGALFEGFALLLKQWVH
jgi:fatty acid desaturase